jgi:hypothetical protein
MDSVLGSFNMFTFLLWPIPVYFAVRHMNLISAAVILLYFVLGFALFGAS